MKKTIVIAGVAWILLVSALFAWNYLNAKKAQKEVAFQTAKSFFKQIVITRKWNAAHTGVYVPVTKDTQPNPYLDDPLRDIPVNKNLTLTKINPSFMTRQISEITDKQGGIQFHMTSLRPLRPENRPTLLEEKALKDFESGTEEIGQIIAQDAREAFFYMAPLKTEKECLSCHARQGYTEGTLRGGISVTLPFIAQVPVLPLIIGHIILGLGGAYGIFLFGTKLDKAYAVIKSQAVTDALTGIPNRRSFSERILAEFYRSRRDKFPLSIIMADIDSFKAYNDAFGHNRGDECLREIALVIQKTITRPSDFCARYGGEEFILVLPNTPEEGAVAVAEKIRAEIHDLAIPHATAIPTRIVTMSLGVSTLEATGAISYEQLIDQADKALYLAKQAGRNRVEVFSKQQ